MTFVLKSVGLAQGNAYFGPYSFSSPIVWTAKNNELISGLEIHNQTGNCIFLSNCNNVIIQNCKLGPSKGEGVKLISCTNITITNCSMDSVETGVYALNSQGVILIYNDVKNVQGPMPRGQIVQFDKIYGSNNRINYNVGENITGQSNPEDGISLYMSGGTIGDPIQIVGNWIRGGGPSPSGGGIMCGDNGGANIVVRDNILVNPGQYGIAIAGGTNITVKNNKVYGKKQAFTNTGLYIWNQNNTPCYSDTVSNNQINWTNSSGIPNGAWNGANCGNVIGWSSNNFNAAIDSTILPIKIIGKNILVTNLSDIKSPGKSFTVYPNPASQSITIETSPYIYKSILHLFNANGQDLFQKEIIDSKTQLDINRLTSGVYFLKLQTEKGFEVKKLMKN